MVKVDGVGVVIVVRSLAFEGLDIRFRSTGGNCLRDQECVGNHGVCIAQNNQYYTQVRGCLRYPRFILQVSLHTWKLPIIYNRLRNKGYKQVKLSSMPSPPSGRWRGALRCRGTERVRGSSTMNGKIARVSLVSAHEALGQQFQLSRVAARCSHNIYFVHSNLAGLGRARLSKLPLVQKLV